jgi:hypothetical protein
MRRALLILGGLCALTWFQFAIFPGHTYLQSSTQEYVPILERLNDPGALSRDLVATNPNVTYTIYDEVTLFLQDAGKMNLRTALVAQQVFFRFLALLGIFLLVRSTGLNVLFSLAAAAVVQLGALLPGPEVSLVNLEPVPHGFAFGLTLLAIGLIAWRMPLLAGLAGGLALVYDPRVASAYWIVVLVAFLSDREQRRLLRPSLTVLAIFVLLLANLSQLQPGVPDPHQVFETISPVIAKIQQRRTGYVWVSTWVLRDFWIYAGLWICELWATGLIWERLNSQLRWMFLLLPALGMASVPVSFLLLEVAHWRLIPQIQPAGSLLFVVAFALIACAIATCQAGTARKWKAAIPFVVVLALAPAVLLPRPPRYENENEIAQLASWAEQTTWGGSMFLFPDAKSELYPGMFRALSKRAVWVDWETGKQAAYFDTFADEWSRRWQDTMNGSFSARRLHSFLLLPIDYFVLKRANLLPDVKPVFGTANFIVYDAHDLRNSPWLMTESGRPDH